MTTAAELHAWVAEYNWDDGVAAIRQVIENGDIEFATALLVYWRLDGPWLDAVGGAVNAEARALAQSVRDGLLRGVFPKGELRYNPVRDNGLTKTQAYQLRRAGVPAELIEPEYPQQAGQA